MAYRDGLTDPDIAIDEDLVAREDRKLLKLSTVVSNYNILAKAVGCIQTIGVDCTDDTSTITTCKLITPTDQLEIGDQVVIGEGGATSRIWYVKIVDNDKISFTDADIIVGELGTANYNAIKNDLMIWIRSKSKIPVTITKNEILLGPNANAVSDNTLPSQTTFAGTGLTIKECLDYLNSLTQGVEVIISPSILRPNGVGDSSEWKPYPDGGEEHYEDVDDIEPDDDATYVTNGAMEGGPNTELFIAIKENSVETLERLGTVEEMGHTEWLYRSKKYSARPSDTGAWLPADINALQIGVKVDDGHSTKLDLYPIEDIEIPEDAEIQYVEIFVKIQCFDPESGIFNFTQGYAQVAWSLPSDGKVYVTGEDGGRAYLNDKILVTGLTKAVEDVTGVKYLRLTVHSNANDPTTDQKAALAGTSGTPSSTNKYVTNVDSRNTDSRNPLSHGIALHDASARRRYVTIRSLASIIEHTVSTGVGGDFRMPFTGVIEKVGAFVDTAGITGTAQFDINKAGTSILTTKITIATATKISSEITPTTTAYTKNDILTFDIDVIQTTPAMGLVFWIVITEATS